jgi:hypothetical protein
MHGFEEATTVAPGDRYQFSFAHLPKYSDDRIGERPAGQANDAAADLTVGF